MEANEALMANTASVVLCGHIAVDILPRFTADGGIVRLTPGSLIEVGEAEFCTGGSVSNTGIALHKLGTDVRLIGKVSDDFFGSLTLQLLEAINPKLAKDITQVPGETSSYTLVVNPPGTDRIFLHCPGTNDTFSELDIDWDRLAGADHFHFGYPPLMKGMYEAGGEPLAHILRTAKEKGMNVSLDMAMPGIGTAAYSVDWTEILLKALPHVDVFMPSLEEMLMMVWRDRYEELINAGGDLCETASAETIRELAEKLLAMGCGIVVLKLGVSGLYMRSSDRVSPKLTEGGGNWTNRELWSPCFRTNVAGTTGAGDCTIAGFLNGLLHQLRPEEAMTGAVAVGAYSVESLDATGGIRSWETIQTRIASGWERLSFARLLEGWQWKDSAGIWVGPADRGGNAS